MNQDSSTTISTEYGEKTEDDIFDIIKEKLQLDENRGKYKGYHSSYIPDDVNSLPEADFTQRHIMMSILKGNDTFAILPTGGGKSFCYQAPSMFVPGVTFIVSPLISLIEDQIDHFNKQKININGYDIRAIAPGVGSTSIKDFFDKISNANSDGTLYKLVYVSPEKLSDPKFCRELSSREQTGDITISLVIVDEAHCLSQMSLDFRESYLFIYKFLRQRPTRPTVGAFTATASQFDIRLIGRILGFSGKKQFMFYMSMEARKDLYIQPFPKLIKNNMLKEEENAPDTRYESLLKILKSPSNKNKRTVIFCTTAAQVDSLYRRLCKDLRIGRNRLHRYHASMTRPQRKRHLAKFSSNNQYGQICVASKALGMGVDCRNISLIIHYDIPLSIEDYYQEIGRGSRGDMNYKAACYLLYEKGTKEEPDRGTSRYTDNWIWKTSGYRSLQLMTVASRLSLRSQHLIIQLNHDRFNDVKKYIKDKIEPLRKSSLKPHDYLMEYFKRRMKANRSTELNLFLDNLETVLQEVNEFHYGNNYLINMLRWHPENYELGKEINIQLEEWSRNNPKNKKYGTIIKTDISYTSAFVVLKGLRKTEDIDYRKVLRLLNSAWKNAGHISKNVSYLFLIADSTKLTILDVFVMGNGQWKLDKQDKLRLTMTDTKTNAKGLLPETRYPAWYVFLSRKAKKENFLEVGPFAFVDGTREQSVSFKIDGDKKPAYFDLCVADAIYTLYQSGYTRIYTKNIWEILSGDPAVKFSRADSKIKTAIEDSVQLLSELIVSISDADLDITINDVPFLPLDKSDTKPGFLLTDTAPLYRYSEALNGEFIRVPVSLFSFHLHQYLKIKAEIEDLKVDKRVLKKPCGLLPMPVMVTHKTEIKDFEIGKAFISRSSIRSKSDEENTDLPFKTTRKTVELAVRGEFSLNIVSSQGEITKLITATTRPWQATIENCVIGHYLIHRISIFRARRRASFLNFNNMLAVLKDNLTKDTAANRRHFIRKTLAILSYYHEIGYVDFVGYCLSPPPAAQPKNTENDSKDVTRLYKVSYGSFVTFWRNSDVVYIKFHDIRIRQSGQRGKTDGAGDESDTSILTGIQFIKKKKRK